MRHLALAISECFISTRPNAAATTMADARVPVAGMPAEGGGMPGGKTDPNQLFGEMLTQWETLSNKLANSIMGTSEFGKGQGAAMAGALKLREAMHDQMSRFFELANMPSREDIIELRDAVAKVHTKLDRIERKLDTLAVGRGNEQAVRAGPPRTKRPNPAAKDAG